MKQQFSVGDKAVYPVHGVAEVVRVIPDPQKDIGLNILSVFHYSRRVRIVTCESLAEAEELFASGSS